VVVDGLSVGHHHRVSKGSTFLKCPTGPGSYRDIPSSPRAHFALTNYYFRVIMKNPGPARQQAPGKPAVVSDIDDRTRPLGETVTHELETFSLDLHTASTEDGRAGAVSKAGAGIGHFWTNWRSI
jgi:hypothetical protein